MSKSQFAYNFLKTNYYLGPDELIHPRHPNLPKVFDGGLIGKNKYKSVGIIINGEKYQVALHRAKYIIKHGTLPAQLDHIDQDKHNNRLDNLRPSNNSQNACNKGRRSDSKNQFKGVRKDKHGKFIAQIEKDDKVHYLGYFWDEEIAALAYNQAALRLHGEFASLNPVV